MFKENCINEQNMRVNLNYNKFDWILKVFVLSGETGCGKTTQITQFILDHAIQAGTLHIIQVVFLALINFF